MKSIRIEERFKYDLQLLIEEPGVDDKGVRTSPQTDLFITTNCDLAFFKLRDGYQRLSAITSQSAFGMRAT